MAGKKTPSTRVRAMPAQAKVMRAAFAHGHKRAMSVIAALRDVAVAREARVPAQSGLLIAEGDSWFDYPLHDVLEILEDRFSSAWSPSRTRATRWSRWPMMTRSSRSYGALSST
jgi:hypothetical protein